MKSLEAVLKDQIDVKVIDASINYNEYTPLDISTSNEIFKQLHIDNAIDFENYIAHFLNENEAKVAFGGYNEVRNLYKRSGIFNEAAAEERNIHIGLDLWIKAGTSILAALDGCVHSFNNNTGLGDYGPTIILEHKIEEHKFYTLYGHLSLESIKAIEIGKVFRKGQRMGTLGDATVNGDYAPHLHFQIITDISNSFGDYPGVCSLSNLEFYLQNCPDPNLLLKII